MFYVICLFRWMFLFSCLFTLCDHHIFRFYTKRKKTICYGQKIQNVYLHTNLGNLKYTTTTTKTPIFILYHLCSFFIRLKKNKKICTIKGTYIHLPAHLLELPHCYHSIHPIRRSQTPCNWYTNHHHTITDHCVTCAPYVAVALHSLQRHTNPFYSCQCDTNPFYSYQCDTNPCYNITCACHFVASACC